MDPPTEKAQEAEPVPVSSVRSTLVTYLLLMVLVLVPLVVLLAPYMVALVSGVTLAVLFYPLYARLRRHLPTWASGLVVTLGVVLLVLAPATAMGIGAFRQGSAVVAQLSSDDTPTLVEIVGKVRHWVPFVDTFGTPTELLVYMKNGLGSLSEAASGVLFRQIKAAPQLGIQIVLIVLSMYFSLVDGRRLLSWIVDKIPLPRQIRNMLAASFRRATNAVVLASVAAAGSQAVVIFIGFKLLGVPAVLLGTGMTFVLGWVPALPTLVWGSAAIYLYSQGSLKRALIMVGIGLVVGVIDNIVRPLVLGGQKAMHPMVSLVAIIGGLVLFGVAGVFIGPLLVCMVIAVFDIWPAVASYCGIPVRGSGDLVPAVPMPEEDD